MRVVFRANRANNRLRLTDGREYEVLLSSNNRYHLVNDNHSVQAYSTHLFDIIDGVETTTEGVNTLANRESEEPVRVEQPEVDRGPVRTEQDIANSINVSFHDNNIEISIDYREHLNDEPQITNKTITAPNISRSSLSCGITEVNNVGYFMYQLSEVLDYQQSDWEILRRALYIKIGELLDEIIIAAGHHAAYSIISIVTQEEVDNDDWREDDYTSDEYRYHVDDIVNYFEYTEVMTPSVNPNSGNRICVLMKHIY